MATPTKFRITLVALDSEDNPFYCESFWFEAFPTASCTLAQHFAAKAWYALQSRLTEPKEGSPSEAR